MIKVKDLAIELSIKLGDSRRDNGDGILFWSEDRLRYIERGYAKLIRTLSMAMRKYKPQFVLPLVPFEVLDIGTGFPNPIKFKRPLSNDNMPFISLTEVIVGFLKSGGVGYDYKTASYLDPANYNQARFGLDEINKPSQENILYTTINNGLYLLPEHSGSVKYARIYAMGIEDLASLTYTKNNIDTEIPIDRTYADMIITFAAIEAMSDLPNSGKVNLYRQELIDQVSVAANYTNLMERNEGEVGNG